MSSWQDAEDGDVQRPSRRMLFLAAALFLVVGVFMVYMYFYDTDSPLPACETASEKMTVEQRC